MDLRTAFQELRGDAHELFTKFPDGKSVDRMKFAVEMLVNRKVQDDLGRELELEYTRLRYELEIVLRTDEYGLDELYIVHELLKAIPRQTDSWCTKYKLTPQNDWLPKDVDLESPFFSFSYMYTEQHAILETHYLPLDRKEEDQVQIIDAIDSFSLKALKRTILSSNTVALSHHAIAAREEVHSWQFLHLNPDALREPGSTNAPRSLSPNGSNLPTTLVRMQAEDKFSLTGVSLDMANLVPGILKIRVEQDKTSDKYVIFAETSDGRSFSSRVLSDGTLRLLALAIMKNDLQFQGVLCLEEPENGVHPQRLRNLARLLQRMATNLNEPEEVDEPLRQVLITTHSPAFISLPEIIDSLLFAYTMTSVEPLSSGNPTLEITCMTRVATPGTQTRFGMNTERDETMEVYTLDQVLHYLDSEDLDEARNQLRKARTTLNEA